MQAGYEPSSRLSAPPPHILGYKSRAGNTFKFFEDLYQKNGSDQGQNQAVTVLDVPHPIPACRAFDALGKKGASCRIQGYLAHENPPPPQDPTVALCIESYGGPRGGAVSY